MRSGWITLILAFVLTSNLAVCDAALAQAIIYVDGDNGLNPPSGPTPGNSWTNSFLHLQDALKHIRDNLSPSSTNIIQVWIKGDDDSDGIVYYPDDGGTLPSDARQATFEMTNGIQLYCGFAGGEIDYNQRNPALNTVILSGDIDHDSANDSDNSFHVVTADSVGLTAILDGATITMGHAPSGSRGGGLLIKSDTSASQPVILRCRFTNNTAPEGAAVSIVTNQIASPDFRNCTFDNNTATTSGVVKVSMGTSQGANVKFQNCLWRDNHSEGKGGALHSDEFAMIHLRNCTITQNTSTGTSSVSAAAVAHDADPVGPGRTFWVRVLNTIIWDNRSDDGESNYTTDLQAQLSGDADVEHSCVQNLFETGSPYASTAVSSIDDDPLFEAPSSNDFDLTCSSPAVNTANNANVEADDFDLNQNNSFSDKNPDLNTLPRIVGVTDMGSYELVASDCLNDVTGDGTVNVADLLLVISNWGPCANPANCPGDTQGPCPNQGDGQVNVADLLAIIAMWGPCENPTGAVPDSFYDCHEMCSGQSGQDYADCMDACFKVLCARGHTEFCE